jgi:hypothetical protein
MWQYAHVPQYNLTSKNCHSFGEECIKGLKAFTMLRFSRAVADEVESLFGALNWKLRSAPPDCELDPMIYSKPPPPDVDAVGAQSQTTSKNYYRLLSKFRKDSKAVMRTYALSFIEFYTYWSHASWDSERYRSVWNRFANACWALMQHYRDAAILDGSEDSGLQGLIAFYQPVVDLSQDTRAQTERYANKFQLHEADFIRRHHNCDYK